MGFPLFGHDTTTPVFPPLLLGCTMSDSTDPLHVYDYAINPTTELDPESELGRAILGERWTNMCLLQQQLWVSRLEKGVIMCNVTISRSRRQIELEIELHPRDYVSFCICLNNFDRFL